MTEICLFCDQVKLETIDNIEDKHFHICISCEEKGKKRFQQFKTIVDLEFWGHECFEMLRREGLNLSQVKSYIELLIDKHPHPELENETHYLFYIQPFSRPILLRTLVHLKDAMIETPEKFENPSFSKKDYSFLGPYYQYKPIVQDYIKAYYNDFYSHYPIQHFWVLLPFNTYFLRDAFS